MYSANISGYKVLILGAIITFNFTLLKFNLEKLMTLIAFGKYIPITDLYKKLSQLNTLSWI